MDKGVETSGERGPARTAPRDSLFLLTSFTTPQGVSLGKARVRNLSATGLMADCDAGLGEGQPVIVELRGIGKVSGSIAWVRAGRMGIVFDSPVDPQLARKPVGEGRAQEAVPLFLRKPATARHR